MSCNLKKAFAGIDMCVQLKFLYVSQLSDIVDGQHGGIARLLT